MAELSNASDEGREEGSSKAPAQSGAARQGWTTRSAVFFWVAVSGAVWMALAASAGWID